MRVPIERAIHENLMPMHPANNVSPGSNRVQPSEGDDEGREVSKVSHSWNVQHISPREIHILVRYHTNDVRHAHAFNCLFLFNAHRWLAHLNKRLISFSVFSGRRASSYCLGGEPVNGAIKTLCTRRPAFSAFVLTRSEPRQRAITCADGDTIVSPRASLS